MEFDIKKYNGIVEFIKSIHCTQVRSFTKIPYYTHCIRTASLVMKFKKSHRLDALVIAALCHDTLEDDRLSAPLNRAIIKQEYGDLVVSLVDELTSDIEKINYFGKTQYLCDKLEHMSTWALVIKLCDRLDNVSDFIFCPDTFVQKYGLETRNILDHIKKNRNLTETHKRIIKEIERILRSYDICID